MKKLMIVLAIALFAAPALQAQEAYDKFEIQVDGLGCPFCAYGLEKKFKEFKGIKEVKIDIETGNFSFVYPNEKALSLKAVESQVEKAGYTPVAASVTRADGTIEASHVSGKGSEINIQHTSASVRVAGNCDMCKARIEKAARDHVGVLNASWDKDSKILQLRLDENATSPEAVEKAIAKAGHDTQNHRAHEGAYKNLPGCCQYERIPPVK